MNGAVQVGKEDKQVKQHYYIIYNPRNYANEGLQYHAVKYCHVIIRSANFYHTLVVCYHANCSILYLVSDMCGL